MIQNYQILQLKNKTGDNMNQTTVKQTIANLQKVIKYLETRPGGELLTVKLHIEKIGA